MKKHLFVLGIMCVFFSFFQLEPTYATDSYEYVYDENNKLIKIIKGEFTYMTFEYDNNGNLNKKVAMLPPPNNIQTEVVGKNRVKISWELVPEAFAYRIYLKSEADESAVEVAKTENNSFEFDHLNIGTNYSFVIKSEGKNGSISDESTAVTIYLNTGDLLVNKIIGNLQKGEKPLPSIVFSLHSLDGTKWYDATSNQEGEFEIYLPDGNYQIDGIWIPTEGLWYEIYQPFTVFNGKLISKEILSIKIEEAKITGTLKKGNEILANVSFSIQSQTGEKRWYQVESDQFGNFSLILPGGPYKLDGVWIPSENHWYEIQKEFNAQGETQLDIDVLEINGSILEGTLKKGEIILPNIQFAFRSALGNEWYSIQTDENGNFSKVIPDGTYILEGVWLESERSWYELQKEFSIKGKFQLSINVLDSIHGNLIGMVKKGTLPVTDTLFSICSTTDGKWYDAKTDQNGNFEFKVPNGTYTIAGIWVKSENKWYELNQSFTVTDSLDIDIDILDFTITIRSNSEN
jgi:hypothetical protein